MLAPFGTLLIHASPLPNDTEDAHDDLLHGLDPEAVLSKGMVMPLTGSRMCELEDMATHPRWSPEEHAFGRTVSVDNGSTMLSKSNALALLFKYSKTTGSADRLRRVQQQAHFTMPQFDPTQREPHSDEKDDILLVNNPVASLLSIHMDLKSVDHIPIDILSEDTIRVTYQVYNLISTSPDDDSSHSNDWCTRKLLSMKFKVPGALVQPINPVLATPPSHAPFYLFETATLVALTSSLCDQMTKCYLKLIPQALQAPRYPYHEASVADPKAGGISGVIFNVVVFVPSYVLLFMEDVGLIKDEVDSGGVTCVVQIAPRLSHIGISIEVDFDDDGT
ncbi:hypothetical protein EDB89DRAFT_1901950 [Lactarius sanguifluus]|nr:hypothetical protein EDB89DRAFT_1901950 [Lactarius sanguifluus]